MNASDYDAVIFDYEVYYIECLPAGIETTSKVMMCSSSSQAANGIISHLVVCAGDLMIM